MTAVIYARYSLDSQREESIDGQLCGCMAFAERQGISVIDTYIDRALSAKTDNRPRFQKMIKDSSNKKFDVIIVWKLDRFSRNRYDSARYKNALKKNDVKVPQPPVQTLSFTYITMTLNLLLNLQLIGTQLLMDPVSYLTLESRAPFQPTLHATSMEIFPKPKKLALM